MGDKMKRGFTLIELLAVIVILGIILAIAIPSVGRIIENLRINTFNRSEELLVNAARIYLALNEENAPRSVGDTIEIKASDLEQLQLLDQIKNPWGNNNCSAYVLATKMSNNTYNYSPHINCTNEITNSSDDKLVAHYKFDDIVEPTENIISNPLDPTKWQTTDYSDLLPYYFRGNMDDLRIYGRVLSDSEIRSIYYSRK